MNSSSIERSGGTVPPATGAPVQGEFPVATPTAETYVPAIFRALHRRYGFRLGPLAFLIKAGTRSEAVPTPVIASLPHSPRWLLGLLNLRGNLVPVFDLKHLCQVEQNPLQKESVLVLDSGEKAVGFPIDALPASVSSFAEKRERPPNLPEIVSGNIGTCFVNGAELWMEFDHETFFSSLQRKMALMESREGASVTAPGADPVQ